MSNPHHRWLLKQLPHWEADGLLTTDAAQLLFPAYVPATNSFSGLHPKSKFLQ